MNVSELNRLEEQDELVKAPIYYYHANGDTYPGVIRYWSVVKKRVSICYDGLLGTVNAHVLPSNISLQNPQ